MYTAPSQSIPSSQPSWGWIGILWYADWHPPLPTVYLQWQPPKQLPLPPYGRVGTNQHSPHYLLWERRGQQLVTTSPYSLLGWPQTGSHTPKGNHLSWTAPSPGGSGIRLWFPTQTNTSDLTMWVACTLVSTWGIITRHRVSRVDITWHLP